MASGIQQIERARAHVASEVYGRLVDAMLEGTLEPGDRLIQDRLANEFDVSRTPVRDALLRLHEEGSIIAAPRRGFVVREFLEADLYAIFDARAAVEGHAAAAVARKGGEAIAHVEATLAEMSETAPTTQREAYEANRSIHRSIVVASGNELLVEFFDSIWGRALRVLAYHESVAGPYNRFVAAHRRLVDEVRSGDPVRAQTAVAEHLSEGLEHTFAARASNHAVHAG